MNARYLGRFLLAALVVGSLTASSTGRTLNDIPAARESLRTMVSPRFFRSLVISPVEACIIVRGELTDDHLVTSKVVHSEQNHRFDSLALELAGNLQVLDYTASDTASSSRGVLVNLLIFQIADGKMAISFAHFERPGGSQLRYSGAAWMAVLNAGKWTTIDPLRLSPIERRGPRSYTLAVETPGSLRSLRGNGRLPAAVAIRGGQDSASHVTRPQ